MTAEITGIKLKELEIPIHDALEQYQDLSQGSLTFELDDVGLLVPTPDKPNSARSQTVVRHLGEKIGDLYVIAFKPGDGTGDEKTYSLDDLVVGSGYPRATKVVPRSKEGTHSEGHLSLLSQKIDDVHADPEKFAGRYDLLGLDGKVIKKMGELGHSTTVSLADLTPITTLTVGWRDSRESIDTPLGRMSFQERFGDPHAVYNPNNAVQVAGFLAISDEVYQKHPEILASLNPREPRQSPS